ncbi:MAG: nucleotidyltransferase family protein, partial [Cyanobium sp.]
LQRIGLFCSTARNEAKAGSDVDVWVERDPLTPLATVHLKQELEALLHRPVDLVRLRERMNPALRQAILREGVSAWCTMATSEQPGETGQMNVMPDAPMP